jgi:hypothetical protein
MIVAKMQPFWWFLVPDLIKNCDDVYACLEGLTQEQWEAIANLFLAIDAHLAGYTLEQWEALTNLLTLIDSRVVLEGNYSTWTFMWNVSSVSAGTHCIRSVDETSDLIIILDGYTGELMNIHTLSTGTLQSSVKTIQYGWTQVNSASVLGKYFASVFLNVTTNHPELRIYKSGVLIQSIDLYTACAWSNTNNRYVASISSSGKYVLVHNYDVSEYALFQGS